MIEKVTRVEGRKTHKFEFEFGNDDLKLKISELEKVKGDENKADIEKQIKEIKSKFKFYEYEIQEPTFEQLTASLGQTKKDGDIDIIGSGKVIWELCCVACDTEIEKNARLLVSVCINICREFALPIDFEIKKK